MPVLQNVSALSLNHCLRSILVAGASEEELDFLISIPFFLVRQDQGYRFGIESIAEKLLEAVGRRKIRRWDFDPADKSHVDQPYTKLEIDWSPPERWSDDHKRKIIFGIVGSYRLLCHRLVEGFVVCFREAINEQDIRRIIEKAKERGVFTEVAKIGGSYLYHNHSIVDASKVWEAYQESLSRIKPLLIQEPKQEKIGEKISDYDTSLPEIPKKQPRNRSFYKRAGKLKKKGKKNLEEKD